tara:strand:- start:209 stop:1027 length:819 start_codon:yes stop_codon:yes gene_type:complete
MIEKGIAIIQARMNSKRLPGKSLMDLVGKPILWHIVQRLKGCKFIDKIIVATSIEESDNPIYEFCFKENINCFRGSLENVYQRYLDVINLNKFKYFARITGDSPLISPEFIDKQIVALNAHDADLIWLLKNTNLLAGQGVQSCASLKSLKEKIISSEDKEHVASIFISNNPDRFRIVGINPPAKYTLENFRVSVDELKDYKMMKNLYESLWEDQPIKIEHAINWMLNNKHLSSSNKSVKDSLANAKVNLKKNIWSNNVKYICDWDQPSKLLY